MLENDKLYECAAKFLIIIIGKGIILKPKIIISKHSGYCMGVKRAFAGAEDILKNHTKICIYGNMVHNRFALKSLIDKGIKIKNNLIEIINSEEIENVIIRAHGVSPEEEKDILKNKNIFDFTCPKVKKVQLLAMDLSRLGHEIIIFGKNDHPEVKGIKGYCRGKIYIIKNLEDAKKINFIEINNPALISQTTMNSIIFSEICEFLKDKFINIKIFNTLCNAPVKIQEQALKLAGSVQAMIVVGDKSSANTTTLFEKLKNVIPCYFIETTKDINVKELKRYKKIGMTGGSSTPDWQIEEIKKFIEGQFEKIHFF